MTPDHEKMLQALLDSQIRSQAILETMLKTQTRILSKVKKEKFDYTEEGVQNVVKKFEKELREALDQRL